jgi:hypothetical protein
MNNNALLLALVAAGVFVMMKRTAATATKAPVLAPTPTKNVNDQLWSSLLGGSWKLLTDAQNSDGSPAFLMKNWLGQTVTSDGKPVGAQLQDLLPATYGTVMPVDLSDPTSGVDWLSDLGW